ncbi:hypothetical protein KI811_16715 [Geobacter hydrogenophilus]|uniref:Uncharacterized protein n=1 Tax=Geobacter hydrogenophilus TaxID=40983 RepID=A0A9W6G0V3_9BACT|nr:hypothetical protein [Geobacter hydrogenophilus]MBT0895449.1 hypothetical protein [Geobacter hydrogenophilus]GLI38327.1 hypothetical protein GHYDROH2_18280 [Geobacter hydrogenophilus]
MKATHIIALYVVLISLCVFPQQVQSKEPNEITTIFVKSAMVDNEDRMRINDFALFEYLSDNKFIRSKPSSSYDMTDYYVLVKPATIMGHKLVLLEYETQKPSLGCCADSGFGVILLLSGSTKELEKVAHKNICSIEYFSNTKLRERLFWKPRKSVIKPGKYAWVSCRESDLRQIDSED